MVNELEKKSMNIRTVVPYVDAWEENDQTIVLADMPGVDEKNVNVNFERGVLTVEGTMCPPEVEGYTAELQEARCVKYKRAFELSDSVDVDGIKAQMKNGILKIILPKREEVKTRKITVVAEEK